MLDKPIMELKRATIKDVAKLAGVSIKTVSRVVRQEPNVKAATRDKVNEAVRELDYRPTVAARSSVGARSYMLGLLFDNPNRSYTSDLIRGVLLETRAQGYHLVVEPIDTTADLAADKIAKFAIQSNLDGIILPPPLSDNQDILKALRALGKPIARIAPSDVQDSDVTISTDDKKAAYEMTRHLIGLGHKDIAMIAGRENTATTERRIQGYLLALEDAGIQIRQDWVVHAGYQYLPARDAGEELLKQENRPTAIFAANDDMAAGVIAAAYKLGLSVPDDVSVAGFDDSVIATVVWPQLTTVRQPVQEMAALAVSRIVTTLRDSDEDTDMNGVVPSELIIRDSTGPAPK